MASVEEFRKMAMSLQNVTEEPHFEKTSFRIKKKIIATLDITGSIACFKFSEVEQCVFCGFDETIAWPVPNKWGKQGWTFINISLAPDEMLTDALETAYANVSAGKNRKR